VCYGAVLLVIGQLQADNRTWFSFGLLLDKSRDNSRLI